MSGMSEITIKVLPSPVPEYEIYHTSAAESGVDEGLRLPLYRVCSVDNARPIVLFDQTQGRTDRISGGNSIFRSI